MKSTLSKLTAGVIFASLLSCQQVPVDSLDSRSLVQLHLSATTLDKADIGEWEDGANEDIFIPGTELQSRATTEAVKRMAFFLIGEDGDFVVEQEKDSDEDGFMDLYAEIPEGTYDLIAFGHNGTSDISVSDDGIITPGQKLTDSFVYHETLTLDEESDSDLDITLDRCVAKFSLKHTDKIPTGVRSVEIVLTGGGNTLEASTGLAPKTVKQTVSINIPASAEGSPNNTFAAYTFLPEEECELDVTVTAKNASGETMVSRSFDDVPMEVNMQTICSGVFFNANQNINASVDSEWKPSKKIEF